jgi:tryptophanase
MQFDYPQFKAIIEPFCIKSLEPIYFTTPEQRAQYLADAGFNPFLLRAEHVLIERSLHTLAIA